MRHPIALALLLPLMLGAQTVYLTGTVRDASEQPIAGATVHLSNLSALSTTTDNDGVYVLSSGATRSFGNSRHAGGAWTVTGDRLQLSLTSAGVVDAALYDLRGRRAIELLNRQLPSGTHTLNLPRAAYATQALLLRVQTHGETHTCPLAGPSPDPYAAPPAKQAAPAAPGALTVLDTLYATSGPSTIRLYVFSYIDTMDFWLGESSQYSEARQQCTHRINFHRSTVGLGPLARRRDKESCVDGQAQSDHNSNTAHGAYGACAENAQNECPRWNTVLRVYTACIQMMWDEGPPPVGEPCNYPSACYTAHGHYINMTNTAYKGVACGFYEGSSVWGVQDFFR